MQFVVFPDISLAVQVTSVEPIAKVDPEAGRHSRLGVGSQSVALTLYVTTVPAGPVHCAVMFAGQTMTGGVTSATVTFAMQVVLRPMESVTVKVRVCRPMLSSVPGAGLWRIVTQQQLSVAASSPVRSGNANWHWPAGSASVRLVGQLTMPGGAGLASLLSTSTRPTLKPPAWPSLTM